MPVITDIQRQKKSAQRYSVYLDSSYGFALSDLELSTSGLRVGQELSAQEVEHYRQAATFAKGYAMALRLLGIRPRSVREMRDYLVRKGYAPEEALAVVEQLQGAGLLNDAQFAASWVASRQALRPRSRRMLEQELSAKGLTKDDIGAALGELDAADELGSLVRLAQKKRRLPQYHEAERLIGYLGRQGYSYDLIKKALERLDDELEAG